MKSEKIYQNFTVYIIKNPVVGAFTISKQFLVYQVLKEKVHSDQILQLLQRNIMKSCFFLPTTKSQSMLLVS